MTAAPGDIARFAARFIERLGDPERFRTDPAKGANDEFGITVVYRANVNGDCDIDGSYDHNLRQITCAEAASAGRERFTILHELGHALGRLDADFNDWLFTYRGSGRLEEERVANAFAAAILLPDHLVAEHIPAEGPTAFDVMTLAGSTTASREAVCVAAANRLRGPGLVAVAVGDTVRFAATRGLPFGIPRNSDQAAAGFFARAARVGHARQDQVRIVLPSGDPSSPLMGDACCDNGYTFAVLMDHNAPWVDLTPTGGDDAHEIDCDACDRTRFTYARPCRDCGDRPCPDHGCSCPPAATRRARKCQTCNIDLPTAAPPGQDHCDNCG